MRRSERIRRAPSPRRQSGDTSADDDEAARRPADDVTSDSEATPCETDALLDEIDQLLESNAEDFVRGYVQKGGE